MAVTLILFILTNIGASLGLISPNLKVFSGMVIGGMLLGMAALIVGLTAELYDSWHNREELSLELADFDRLRTSPNEKQRIEQQQAPPPKAKSASA